MKDIKTAGCGVDRGAVKVNLYWRLALYEYRHPVLVSRGLLGR